MKVKPDADDTAEDFRSIVDKNFNTRNFISNSRTEENSNSIVGGRDRVPPLKSIPNNEQHGEHNHSKNHA